MGQTVPRCTSVAVTLAFGTAAPDGSVIVPVMPPVISCALTGWEIVKRSAVNTTANPQQKKPWKG
jgi:hypothetical protein